MLAPRLSSTLRDLQIILKLRFSSSTAFTATRNGGPTLPGLLPLRHEVIQLLHRLRDANVEILPFTVGITAEWGPLSSETPIFVLEYVPGTYNTPERRQSLPPRMHLFESPQSIELLGIQESRKVFGGDELRFYADQVAVEEVFMGVLGMEGVVRFGNAVR
jgi:hypothetical protein